MLILKNTISIYSESDRTINEYNTHDKSKPYIEIHDISHIDGKPTLGAGRAFTENEAKNIFAYLHTANINKKVILPYNVLMWHTDSTLKGYECIFWIKAHVAPIHFTGNRSFLVPWPSMIFKVNNRSIKTFALRNKRSRPHSKTALYHMPAWNTSDDGSVCTGNFSMADCKAPEEAIKTWTKFWFDADFSHASGSVYRDIDLVDFWQSLDGKTAFPTDCLVKSPLILEDLI